MYIVQKHSVENKWLYPCLPLASDGVAPQSSLRTIGAKAMNPSTQCFLTVSMMEGGKWMWRSQRNTMLWSS